MGARPGAGGHPPSPRRTQDRFCGFPPRRSSAVFGAETTCHAPARTHRSLCAGPPDRQCGGNPSRGGRRRDDGGRPYITRAAAGGDRRPHPSSGCQGSVTDCPETQPQPQDQGPFCVCETHPGPYDGESPQEACVCGEGGAARPRNSEEAPGCPPPRCAPRGLTKSQEARHRLSQDPVSFPGRGRPRRPYRAASRRGFWRFPDKFPGARRDRGVKALRRCPGVPASCA